ncbi:MAG: HRDC domain-containing protein [Candidatus Nanoarchaeia archaeon]
MIYLEEDMPIEAESEIAVDLECENNLHHFGCFISIIQLSTKKNNYVVDVLKIKNPGYILSILENEKIEKVFHDVDFDFRILNEQFNCRPKNIFDTKIAAEMLGKEKPGLSFLLNEYFNMEKKSKFQMADWTKRPLSKEMLEYAVNDTIYLRELKLLLEEELREKGLLNDARNRFRQIEKTEYKLKKQSYSDIKGYSSLSDEEKKRLKKIFLFREKWAKKLDKPPFFIIGNKKLIELVRKPPTNWENVKSVHPIVRKKGNELNGKFNPVSKNFIKKRD